MGCFSKESFSADRIVSEKCLACGSSSCEEIVEEMFRSLFCVGGVAVFFLFWKKERRRKKLKKLLKLLLKKQKRKELRKSKERKGLKKIKNDKKKTRAYCRN